MPKGKVEEASNMDELHHNVCHPAKDIYIVPGIERDSLLSIPKFVDANYIAIFDNEEVNIYDANKPIITVSCSIILRGWGCGTYPSPRLLKMKTPTQSSAIDAQQNSSQTDHHQSKQSTTCTS